MSKMTLQLMAETKEDDKNRPTTFEKASGCPFCNSNRLTVKNQDIEYWVRCRDCGGDGPPRPDRINAIGMWNRRA